MPVFLWYLEEDLGLFPAFLSGWMVGLEGQGVFKGFQGF